MVLHLTQKGPFRDVAVYVNGSRVRFEHGAADVALESGEIALAVVRQSPLTFPHWFLTHFFCWLFGLFGLFSPRYDKNCDRLDYRLKAFANGDVNMKLELLPPRDPRAKERAVYVLSDIPFTDENPVWIPDARAKKRRKVYRACNGLFWGLAVPAAIAVTVLSLIGVI